MTSRSPRTEPCGSPIRHSASRCLIRVRCANRLDHRSVYRHDPDTGEIRRTADFDQPNGLAFTADGLILYVSDTARSLDGDTHDIVAFDVAVDGSLSGRRLFQSIEPGIPDGFVVDERGWVWTTSKSGMQIFAADGAKLGLIPTSENWRAARMKPEIALAEIDRIRAAGVRFATVLADAGYGLSAPFRQGLDARGLKWAVGIPKQQKVYPSNVRLVFPIAGRGRPRKRHIPDQLSAPAEDVLATAKWRRVSWRKGTKGPLAASFAAVRVRIADGPPQRIHEKGMQHMPGEEAWLVGERRASGERKYYLSNLPPDANLKTLAA